jgi:hypothetical protein
MKVLEGYNPEGVETFSEAYGVPSERYNELVAHYEAARDSVVNHYVSMSDSEFDEAGGFDPFGEIGTVLDNNGEEYNEKDVFFLNMFMYLQRDEVARNIMSVRTMDNNPMASTIAELKKLRDGIMNEQSSFTEDDDPEATIQRILGRPSRE